MNGEVILNYGRDGERYTGSIWYQPAATRGMLKQFDFDRIEFKMMLTVLAETVKSHDARRVTLRRTESEKLKPFLLDTETVELLKTDPARVIRSMMPPPMQVVVRDKVEVSTEQPVLKLRPVLTAGHDTLADAFGDDVYIRRKRGLYESPITGRWENPGEIGAWVVNASEYWAFVPTQELINYNEPRYFLPRAWNTKGPWISHEDLKKMYDEFNKERENVR